MNVLTVRMNKLKRAIRFMKPASELNRVLLSLIFDKYKIYRDFVKNILYKKCPVYKLELAIDMSTIKGIVKGLVALFFYKGFCKIRKKKIYIL